MSIGENIQLFRQANLLTQDELARKSGISRNAISNYERDERSPTIDTLQSIANALDVPVISLLDKNSYTLDEVTNKMIELSNSINATGTVDKTEFSFLFPPSEYNFIQYNKLLSNLINSKYTQSLLNYNISEFDNDSIEELYSFITQMLEIKMNELKYKKLENNL